MIGRISNAIRRLHRKYSPRLASYMRVAYLNPRRVVLVTTRHESTDNVWPMDWHTPLSFDPPQYGIAINCDSYGAELVRSSGVFIINFVPAEWEEIVLSFGRSSGRDVDKLKLSGVETDPGLQVDAPRLRGALGYLECRLVDEVDAGDHVLFVGEVLVAEECRTGRELYHETA